MKGNFNVEIGALPTLVGAEYTFTFENMNIERGLLWNQEPAISRGIQLNDTYKKLTLSFSWNDGFYSNRYTSLSGSAGLCHQWLEHADLCRRTAMPEHLVRVGPPTSSAVTPSYQNNEQIYNLIYTYSQGNCDDHAVLPIHGREIECDVVFD